jgi:ribosomal protein S12 methylthiotransferase
VTSSYWVETLGCPKNEVDSDKLVGTFHADGMVPAASAAEADLVVVNTCAFIDAAREESIGTVLDLAEQRRDGARLVVTGCMAERYGDELAAALPEVDAVVGFSGQAALAAVTAPELVATPVGAPTRLQRSAPALDLLNLPRPRSVRPWAYVKVAEGCDKACGFCAIPSFRGPQRSRTIESVLAEVSELDVQEVVLVAQDLAAFGRDRTAAVPGERSISQLVREISTVVPWVRLLYLYPSELTDELIELIATGPVPYFDLSLQHVSAPLVKRMRRWGDGDRFAERIRAIRSIRPDAAFRSNFIVGYPGETEDDHDQLLRFVEEAQLDWCGFFTYSVEAGTYAADLDGAVPTSLMHERLRELAELQDRITGERRDALVGDVVEVLVDEPGVARSHREAPEIDGIIGVPASLAVGERHRVRITAAAGPDLTAVPVDAT